MSAGRSERRLRDSGWASGPRARWRWLVVVAWLVASLAFAEVLAVDARRALWVAPFEDGVAALLADGTVLHVDEDGRLDIAHGWISEEIWPCGDALYGVDRRGRIAAAGGPVGPGVAQYATPACLPSGDLVVLAGDAQTVLRLNPRLEIEARVTVEALADTTLVPARLGGASADVVALLAEPTFRYRHGVLGDEVEAASLVVLAAEDLSVVARWSLPPPAVIEQRTVVPYAFGTREGFYVTRSTPDQGAGVIAVELIPTASGGLLRPSAAGRPIGRANRWQNLFAGVDARAYAVHTPHLGGPFVRYRLSGATLQTEAYDLGVTNHLLGSRNVELGALLASDGEADLLVLPTRDLHALRVVRCADTCVVVDEAPLSGRLTSNLAVARAADSTVLVLAADDAGAIHRIAVDPVQHGLDEAAVR